MADSPPNRVENNVRKGEIPFITLSLPTKSSGSNLSFSHSVFKRLVLQTHVNQGLFWKRLTRKSFKNTVWKGEIARSEQFLLFPQCFLPLWRTFCHFHQIWNCCLQTLKFVVWERVNAFTRIINPCYPVQADMGWNFSLPLHFLHVKELFCVMSYAAFWPNRFYGSIIEWCLALESWITQMH